MVVGEGFEPSKLSWQIYSLLPLTAREPHPREGAHSCFAHSPCQPFTHSLRSSCSIKIKTGLYALWCRHQESNPGPTDYKSVALPAELYRHTDKARKYRQDSSLIQAYV